MEEAHFIFTSEPIELKAEGEDFFVEGYISTSDIDLVNDIVTKGCIQDMADQMRQRTIKFDVEHESFRGKSNLEIETNKTIIPAAKVDDFLIDKKGLKVRAKLNKHSQRFDEVKGSIQDGFLDAFSIAYVPMKSTMVTKGGQQVRMLDKINLLNVAFTGNPVNTEAKMTNVFAKSLDFLKEQEEKSASSRTQARNEALHEEDQENKLEETDEEKKKKEEEAKKKKEESKNHIHESDKIKLQEVIHKMSEENGKVEEKSEATAEQKATIPEKVVDEKNNELMEVKSELATVKSEIAEIKAMLKKPMLKSKVEQQDKSDNFVEKKSSQNPLDLIA